MLPFLLYSGKPVKYSRFWFKTLDGCEVLATDWSFPDGGYTPGKILIILHGLNGGSGGAFITDAVHVATSQGISCCVITARGNEGTPIRERIFHGARTTDLHMVATMIREICPGSTLVAAGFSMGGCVVANYLGKFGDDAKVDGAISIAGCYDINMSMKFKYGVDTYHRYLAYGCKVNLIARFEKLLRKQGISTDRILSDETKDMIDLDSNAIAPFYKYKNVSQYYDDISLSAGDKLSRVSKPLLAVHAIDDPIIDVNTHPIEKADAHENLFFLITQAGGHTGWSEGVFPVSQGFARMGHFACDWLHAVHNCQ